jgi:hypothetical protein
VVYHYTEYTGTIDPTQFFEGVLCEKRRTMRLFRKNVVRAGKGKKMNNETENQYEYVRKEFGFDYVPPSQYVPSHSVSEDEDEDVPGCHLDDDAETIEVQYRGAAPVKIIQPRSDLSGSIIQEDDDLFVPEKSARIHRRVRGGTKTEHLISRQAQNSYPSRRDALPIPEEEEEEEEEEYGDDDIIYPEDRHYDLKLSHRDQLHRVLPTSPRRTREKTSFRPQRPERHEPEPRATRGEALHGHPSHEAIRRKSNRRGYVIDDLDELDIGRVHTAFSYNSDDSAENLVEEQSRGSRYNTGRVKKSRRPVHQRHPRDGIPFHDYPDRDLDDRVAVRTESLKKIRNEWEFEGDNVDNTIREKHPHLEKFEKPRDDRRRSTRRETRQETHNDYRKSRVYVKDEVREDDRVHKESLEALYRRQDGRSRELNDQRDALGMTKTSRRSRLQDWDSKEIYSRRRKPVDVSYYASPSGKVASDFDVSGPKAEPRLTRQKRSKGLLGRIRESVRGPPRQETRTGSGSRDLRVSEARAHPEVGRDVKSIALFEQVQPSMRSDVSHENRGHCDFQPREPDVPSALRRTKVVSYPPGRDARPVFDSCSEDGYNKNEEGHNSRRKSSHRRRHGERRLDYGQYNIVASRGWEDEGDLWEPPGIKASCYSGDKTPNERYRSSSTALPFETARNETPPLRHNPDRRRSANRPYAKGQLDYTRHYSKGQLGYRSSNTADETGRYTVAQEIRFTNLTSPKLIREHPNIVNSVHGTTGQGFRIGCY